MAKNTKFVYSFGGGKAEGKASMRDILGGKGAGLHEMTRIGVPVPPGFTITTDVCTYYYAYRGVYPKGLEIDVSRALKRLEKNSANVSAMLMTHCWYRSVLEQESRCLG